MIAVVQRVREAGVTINDNKKAHINKGILVLIGIEEADNEDDVQWLSAKIVNMRIFDDVEGKMNLSVQDVNGDILIISQFTLHASTKKGNRPSFVKAAKPEIAIPIYEKFLSRTQSLLQKQIYTGEFGADMKVNLINDGPVTIVIDSRDKK